MKTSYRQNTQIAQTNYSEVIPALMAKLFVALSEDNSQAIIVKTVENLTATLRIDAESFITITITGIDVISKPMLPNLNDLFLSFTKDFVESALHFR